MLINKNSLKQIKMNLLLYFKKLNLQVTIYITLTELG